MNFKTNFHKSLKFFLSFMNVCLYICECNSSNVYTFITFWSDSLYRNLHKHFNYINYRVFCAVNDWNMNTGRDILHHYSQDMLIHHAIRKCQFFYLCITILLGNMWGTNVWLNSKQWVLMPLGILRYTFTYLPQFQIIFLLAF